jgi:hypothetical protein
MNIPGDKYILLNNYTITYKNTIIKLLKNIILIIMHL